MKGFLFIVVVVLLCILLGWVTFTRRGDHTEVTLDSETFKADTERAGEVVEQAAEKTVDGGKRVVDEINRTEVDVDINRKPASVEN